MAPHPAQTRENHVRFHPPFHFFFAPAVILLLAFDIYQLVRSPTLFSFAQLLLLLVVAVVGTLARTYALKVQDRVIRLEERLRLATLLPTHLQPAVYEFSEQQLIALRFASDEELAALAERVRSEHLDPKAIKQSVRNWRPDYFRV